MLVFKNIFSYGLTYKGLDWLGESGGSKAVFFGCGAVQVVVCMLTVPMCKFRITMLHSNTFTSQLIPAADVFGKRSRSFWSRRNVFLKASESVANVFNSALSFASRRKK